MHGTCTLDEYYYSLADGEKGKFVRKCGISAQQMGLYLKGASQMGLLIAMRCYTASDKKIDFFSLFKDDFVEMLKTELYPILHEVLQEEARCL